MKTYNELITLIKNGRGVWCLDTTMGCASGLAANRAGCYSDCYANRAAKARGFDFSKTIKRSFKNGHHRNKIVRHLNSMDMPFVRLGCNGDPSEDWEHTLAVLADIRGELFIRESEQFGLFGRPQYAFPAYSGEIVMITRHWKTLTDGQLLNLESLRVCVNTSVSALDSDAAIAKSLTQYERLKPFCKSVLRIISCDFNTANKEGLRRAVLQDELLHRDDTLETVFRPSLQNRFVLDGVINTERAKFVSGKQTMSKRVPQIFTGKCGACSEKCGVGKLIGRSTV